MHKTGIEVAEFLIDNGVMSINFDKKQKDWINRKHGIVSPIYLDCRILLKNPECLNYIMDRFRDLIEESSYGEYTIFGVETAGIPFASILASVLHNPLGYIRKNYKSYGMTRLIEGLPPHNSKAIIIDDNCFTGITMVESIESLKKECNISTIVLFTIISLSDYSCVNHWAFFKQNKIPLFSLTDYKCLNKVALRKKLITKKQFEQLNMFYKDPFKYKW